jgi:radical SAM superfamily enzyme YgiQ (UPF0313 family)
MSLVEPVFRPPSEAASFLLQVTVGCSSDDCAFCGMYKMKSFRVKDPAEVFTDIDQYARRYPATRRVFLMDGDALVLSNAKLIPILDKLGQAFPRLARVSSYANGSNITKKTSGELKELAARKLNLIYMGLETGSQFVLDRCGKASSVREMVEAVRRAEEAGIRSSVMVLLGLGGRELSAEHVRGTIEALNAMQPRYLSFLSLMIVPGTPLEEELKRGAFKELDARELLRECYGIVCGLELKHTVFRSNHASNYLPLEGTFPKDKPALLEALRFALDGKIGLRPGFARGL